MKNCQNSFAFLVFAFAMLLFSTFATAQQRTPLLELYSHWDRHSHQYVYSYNSLWGWTSSTGREYAILGSLDSIYFFDVTDPSNIRLCDARAGRNNFCINRNFKTYKNYCYAVADNNNCSLQIFDLKYLPDSVHKVYDSDTLSSAAHCIFIDGDRLYLTYNKRIFTDGPPGDRRRNETNDIMTIASLANPEVPTFIANLHPKVINGTSVITYVHDVFVRNDTAYCCCGGDGMFIYNYKDSINPVLLQALTDYPDGGFNHSCWLSKDGNKLVFTDENKYARVKLYDVSALKTTPRQPPLRQICLFGSHSNEGSIGHNAYMKGNLLYMSYYEDGVVIFDMSDDSDSIVTEIASYDTYPQNTPGSYHGTVGCWNVYPFFPSGTIIASDTRNGLFVLRLDSVSYIDSDYISCGSLNIKVLQNPFRGNIYFAASTKIRRNADINLYDMMGQKLFSSSYYFPIGTSTYNIPCLSKLSGMVILSVSSDNCILTRKLIQMGG